MTHSKQPAAGARAGGKKASPARRTLTGRVKARTTPAVKGVDKKRRSHGQRVKPKPATRKPKVKPLQAQAPKRAKEVAWTPEMPLPDGQQERFCRLMAQGAFSNYSCYLQSYPSSSVEAARSSSSDLLTKPNIQARIRWIREDSLKDVKIRVEESLRWYQTVRDTPVGYIDEESPLAQEVQKEIEGTEESGPLLKVKVKIPSKMDAAKQIDKLMGFEKPQEINLNLPYEPPNVALERLASRGIDLAGLMAKAGLIKS